jgi:hypothetical protein
MLDEKIQPIPWTKWPTGALVGVSSFWPIKNMKYSQLFAS